MRKIASEVGAGGGELRRLDGDALYAALTLLATDIGTRRARDAAARTLLGQLRLLSSRAWLARFSWSAALRRSGDFAAATEDAIQHVAVVASTGKSRFRGGHPREAVAWCRRIFLNFLTSESRRRARTVSVPRGEVGDGAAPLPAQLEGIAWRPASQEAALLLRRLEARVWSHLRSTRSLGASRSLYRAVRDYLRYISGQPEQAASSSELATGAPLSISARRARDRRYQYHSRARRILAELLAMDAPEALVPRHDGPRGKLE